MARSGKLYSNVGLLALAGAGAITLFAAVGLNRAGGGGGGGGTSSSSVTVVVTDSGTKAPIAAAAVGLGNVVRYTSIDGSAVFDGVANATYNLSVNAAGYQSYSSTTVIRQSVTIPISLVAGTGCTPVTCPCDQTWFSSGGTCGCYAKHAKVISVSAPSALFFSWGVTGICGRFGAPDQVKGYSLRDSTGTQPVQNCPRINTILGSCATSDSSQINNQPWAFTVNAQLFSNPATGETICNRPVQISLPPSALWTYTEPGNTGVTLASGRFTYTPLDQTVYTDQNGVAQFTIVVNIVVDYFNYDATCRAFPAGPCLPDSPPLQAPVLLNFLDLTDSIPAAANVQLNMKMCLGW